MQKVLVALATLFCAPPALAMPTTDRVEGDPVGAETGTSSTAEVTRSVALWTHGITAAASFVGGAVYGIRGLRGSDVAEYEDDCESGVPGACNRYEARERERRVDQFLGGALIIHSMASLSDLFALKSTDPRRLDPSDRSMASVLYGTSAALSAATAGLLIYTLKLRSDFGDAADACFEGNCNEIPDAASDVDSSLAAPLIVTGVNYVLSVSSMLWLTLVERHDVTLAPVLDPNYTGATLTGRF